MSDLENRVAELEADMAAIKTLIQKTLQGEGKLKLDVSFSETIVNLHHAGDITVNLDTNKTLEDRVIFCAIEDLKRKPFTESAVSAELDERGWHVVHSVLANCLARLVTKNYLIKMGTKKPLQYRLPGKIHFNVV